MRKSLVLLALLANCNLSCLSPAMAAQYLDYNFQSVSVGVVPDSEPTWEEILDFDNDK